MNVLKCHECLKKLNLSNSFQCKCSYIFCPTHRYMETHHCEKMNDEIMNQKKILKENLYIEKNNKFISKI